MFDADELICVADLDLDSLQIDSGRTGRKKAPRTAAASGRYIRSAMVAEGERDYDLAPDATLRAALLQQRPGSKVLTVGRQALRKKIYRRPRKTLIVFVVDSSDSMGDGTFARIKAAKGAVLAILAKAYQKRHRVGLICFRQEAAEVVLQPTASLTLARRSLKALPTGGATPLADGLMKAWRMVQLERLKDPHIKPLLVLLSDGEANVPHDARRRLTEVKDELSAIATRIGGESISAIVIDTAPLTAPSATMRSIAEHLGGSYHHISRLQAGGMVRLVAGF